MNQLQAINIRTKDLIQFALLLLLAVSALAGCAELEPRAEVRPLVPAPAVRKVATRELGALWSEDSSWNHVYTAAAARVTGDLITIRLDEALRKRIAQYKQQDPPDGAGEAKGERAPASTPAKADASAPQDLYLKGTIEEVGQRGVYRITAADTIQLGDWQPYVVIKGRVRDRDIASNDEIQVASIVDLDLDVSKGPVAKGEEGRGENVSW